MIGQTISHYKITAKLGEGGMGVVYKAEDTKLDRPVALKFLAPHLLRDRQGRQRFEREAKAAARLDHPNICTVHEIDEFEGQVFIVMAFLEGRPLSEKIKKGPLKLPEVYSIAIQMAEGLAAAHEKGITHRDIKPENVMLTAGSRGVVKLMDFGLARLAGGSKFTREGTTLGTVNYMSPEQAEGLGTDHRTDVWSFGVVLYEMVAGQRPFRGDFDQAIVYSLVNEMPEPLTALRTGVPKELERIVDKCTAKKPEQRYQHTDELLVDLRVLNESRASTVVAEPVPRKALGRTWRYLAAAAATIAIAATGLWISRRADPSNGPPEQTLRAVPFTSYEGSETTPSFSPDGSQVVFSWDGGPRENFDIYAEVIGSGSLLRLTQDPASDTAPAWSPNGRYIAFIRSTGKSGEAAVYLISPLGGAERKLAEGVLLRFNEFWPARLGWSLDAKTLYLAEWDGEFQGIYAVEVETGEKRRLTSPPRLGDYSLAVSPDGETLAFARLTEGLASTIFLMPARGGDARPLAPLLGSASVAWMPSGKEIVYGATQSAGFTPSLWKVAVAGGAPSRLPILDEGGLMPAVSPSSRRLIYVRRSIDANMWRGDRPERDGEPWKSRAISASTQYEGSPKISPDGRRIAFASVRSGSTQIWVADSDGSNPTQLTALEPMAGSPRWSPDGRNIVFDARPNGTADIFVISSEGGPPRAIVAKEGDQSRPSWSRDGKWIYFASNHTGTQQIWKTPVDGGDLIQLTRGGAGQPFESPDGRFVYYGLRSSADAIWKVPAEGGVEAAVFHDRAPIRDRWAVASDGIYFVGEESGAAARSTWWLKLFRFDTQEVTVVTKLDRPPHGAKPLDVSLDGKWFIYTQTDRNDSDLMLVENFR